VWFSNRESNVKQCKAVCQTCKIRLACLASALEYEEMAGAQMIGTQGGLSQEERRITKFKRIA
jgi:hypothetical protein